MLFLKVMQSNSMLTVMVLGIPANLNDNNDGMEDAYDPRSMQASFEGPS